MKMKATEDRMRALGLLTPMSVLTLDEWEIPRDRVVINRKIGEGAFGTVYGGESFFDEKGWVSFFYIKLIQVYLSKRWICSHIFDGTKTSTTSSAHTVSV